jgi:P-type Cu2+ transporter
MCCLGCKAVAEQIVNFGLTDYYQHRTQLAEKPETLVPDELKQLTLFNNPQIQSEFVSINDDASKEAKLIIEGISCPACVWLIESRIAKLDGVNEVNVNYSTQRCRVNWSENKISLGDILASIAQLGYNTLPYNPRQRELFFESERKIQLIRLGIAGLFGMQVMMIAIALYFGDATGIESHYRNFFNWISLLLCLPVLLYSGHPIFSGALRDIKNKRLGMDVPIALGLSIAFISSVWSTFQQSGHVYYDSIVMFIFFILGGRYFEFMSRRKSTSYLDKTSSILPLFATKVLTNGEQESIELSQLSIGDKVLVKPGDVIPVDGIVIEGQSSLNESIITGESLPAPKHINSKVIGGSTNNESPLYIEVKEIGEKTFLSNISRIIEKASSNKPDTILLANKIVSFFIAALLTIACLVALYWYQLDQSRWLEITIAVLVVSCPCALSLATPTAMSSAATTLIQNGITLLNSNAIEKIHNVNCYVFDKTGTLTKGELTLERLDIHDHQYNKLEIMNIAAALESASEHPIAKAIINTTDSQQYADVSNIKNYPGEGISGEINKQYFIGTSSFINSHCKINVPASEKSLRHIVLATTNSLIATFYFNDEIREDSKSVIENLKQHNKKVILMSGDQETIVKKIAEELNIEEYYAELKPEEKLSKIEYLQKHGDKVCMIGDGINDSPAFAQAECAIAMTKASDITKLNADILFLTDRIDTLTTMLKIITKTNQTIKMNFIWALGYNLIALPFATMGYLAPWMAALGMSLSSLIVVINANRINKGNYS